VSSSDRTSRDAAVAKLVPKGVDGSASLWRSRFKFLQTIVNILNSFGQLKDQTRQGAHLIRLNGALCRFLKILNFGYQFLQLLECHRVPFPPDFRISYHAVTARVSNVKKGYNTKGISVSKRKGPH
jgi:hypothetical protein